MGQCYHMIVHKSLLISTRTGFHMFKESEEASLGWRVTQHNETNYSLTEVDCVLLVILFRVCHKYYYICMAC